MKNYNLIKDINPIKIEKINNDKMLFFICEKCCKEYTLKN